MSSHLQKRQRLSGSFDSPPITQSGGKLAVKRQTGLVDDEPPKAIHVDQGSRSPGSAQWEDLPEPVQRLVLSRPMLSLRQLAKLATSCKLFEEVFLERYEADLAWLVECATSAFGQGMIGAALRFFSQEWDCLGNEVVRWDQIFDTEGADDSEGYTTAVEAPARGLLGECGGTIARWQFTKLSEDCGSVILITLGGLASFRAEAEGAQLNCYISAEYPCQIIPCLGLLHLLLKQAWDCNVKRATSAPARHREWETILLIDEMDQPKRRLPGDEVSGVPEDVQRAFSALHMWAWRTWGSALSLFW